MQNLRSELSSNESSPGGHRIGAVARLAGVPVTTLRVWETRYAAFEPVKSAGGHRLYGEADVIRARLLRQLTGSGHAIGRIAGLPLQQLQALLAASGAQPDTRRVTAVVVGASMAVRVNSPQWQQLHFGAALTVRRVHADLEGAADAQAEPGGVDLLLLRLNALLPATVDAVLRVLRKTGAQRGIVLYNFGSERVVDAARAAGLVLRREPVPDAELAELVRSVVWADAPAAGGSGATVPPRRFSDEDLAHIAASPGSVMCECPRHIAELIGQLAAFEDYSDRCLNDSAEDAALHAYLKSVASSSRALFEIALQKVADMGAVTLPPGAYSKDGPLSN